MKTKAPRGEGFSYFYNERKKTLEKVPAGVHPAFNWNPGKVIRQSAAEQALQTARENYESTIANIPMSIWVSPNIVPEKGENVSLQVLHR